MKSILKAISLTLVTIIAFVLIVFVLFFKNIDIKYGNHFNYINETGFYIDSLEISVCETKTMHLPHEDSTFGGNIDAPETGYPCEVKFKIFSNSNIIQLKADDFNCYECDGNHQYTLTKDGAIYKFLN